MFPVADGHCDFLYGAVNGGYDLDAPAARQSISAAGLREGGVALQFFARLDGHVAAHPAAAAVPLP